MEREKGKFYEQYRSGRGLKYVAPWLLEEKGWTCTELVMWFIDELIRCDEPVKFHLLKRYNPNPETASLVVYLTLAFRDWIYTLTECIGRKYKLHEKCNCFHKSSSDVGKMDIHRLKDMVCYLKKYGCITDADFEDLKRELLKICKRFGK